MKKIVVPTCSVFTIWLLMLATFLLVSCSNDANLPTQSNIIESIIPADEVILQLAYSSYRYPEGFYQEELQNGYIYYENTTSITPPQSRGNTRIELCTDSHDQALGWSELSDLNSAYHRQLAAETDTERYYEFKRVYAKNPSDILLSRVHKCAYIDRSMYDMFAEDGEIGIFNQRPITFENTKSVAEYLWFIDNYIPLLGGAKVISSRTYDLATAFEQDIIAMEVSHPDWGKGCDQIRVLRAIYVIAKDSGAIALTQKVERTIQGQCY